MEEATTWVGIDAHAKTLFFAQSCDGQMKEWQLANEGKSIRRIAKKLVREAPGEVRCCYEAGPTGYALKRELEAAAPDLVCEVIAPSLIPTKAGERVKTDRRDARKLASYLEAGLLTEVHPPTPAQETVRDLVRCRRSMKSELMRARHRLSKLLLRRGLRYVAGKKAWTAAHRQWLHALRFDDDLDRFVFGQYLLAIEQVEQRIEQVDLELTRVSETPAYREAVGWLGCFRGVGMVTAMTVLAEIHDFRRFASPLQLMAYIGLTPSEHSSGDKTKRGRITKTGNTHVRRILVEAGWHYRHQARVGATLRKRRENQPAWAIAKADKAQLRLCRRHRGLIARGKPSQKANVAVARELVGFLWSAMREGEARQQPA